MIVFPSLSTQSFISDRGLIIKKVMESFIASFKSQSNVFPVNSYRHIVANNEQGVDVSNAIEKTLTEMYKLYFESVLVKVTYTMNNNDNLYVYNIEVTNWYNGIKYQLDKSVTENMIVK